MRITVAASLASALAFSLVGCGPPQEEEEIPIVDGVLSGTARKGPIAGGTVVIYEEDNGIWRDVAGAGTTDDAGNFDVSVGLRSGDLLVTVSHGTYVESATGRRVGVGGRRLEAWARDFSIGEKREALKVNPVTTWIVAYTRWRMAELGESLDVAELQATAILNEHLGGVDWRLVAPRNLTTTRDVPFDDRAIAGLVTASISELVASKAEHAGQGAEVNSAALVALVAEDLEGDGLLRASGFNDRTLRMHGAELGTETLRLDLARSMYRFVESERNGSGLSFADVQDLITRIAESRAEVFPSEVEPDLRPIVVFESPSPGSSLFGEMTVRATAHARVTEVTSATLVVGSTEVPASVLPDGLDGIRIEATVNLSDVVGPLEVEVRAQTRLGRTGSASVEVLAMEPPVGPVVTGLTGPADPTSETTATFEFGCSKDGCTFECRLDGAVQGEVSAPAPCDSGVTYSELADDTYTFSVVATDEDDESSPPATWTWMIDTAEPVVEISSGPDVETTDSTVTFEFGCVNKDGCVYECALNPEDLDDPEQWEACSSPWSYAELERGSHAFNVRAVDRLGAVSDAAAYTWDQFFAWSDVTSGVLHSCGLGADGSVWCWGYNGSGQLGSLEVEVDSIARRPTRVGADSDWMKIAAHHTTTCGLREPGTLWCWGAHHEGIEHSLVPLQVGTWSDWSSISPGSLHTCGLREDLLWCWGYNSLGQLGDSSRTFRPEPVPVGADRWTSVSTGFEYTCGVRDDGSLWCWGSNSAGQLGIGDPELDYSEHPRRVGTHADWLAVVAGNSHACGLRADGSLWCWGSNGSGQIGVGDDGQERFYNPTQVFSVTSWESVSAGSNSTCAVDSLASLWCWGQNSHGQLAVPEPDKIYTPLRIEGYSEWSTAAPTQAHTCGIRAGFSYCWGSNANGALGDGQTEDRVTPGRVKGP